MYYYVLSYDQSRASIKAIQDRRGQNLQNPAGQHNEHIQIFTPAFRRNKTGIQEYIHP